jgi:hypothetical protein
MSAKNIAYRGFDASFEFDLSDALAAGVDLIGKTALFTVKHDRKAADSTAVLKRDFIIDADHLDTENTKLLIIAFDAEDMQLVAEVDGGYYFDLKIFNPDGSGLVYVPYDPLTVIDDVTDRIAIS